MYYTLCACADDDVPLQSYRASPTAVKLLFRPIKLKEI